MPVACRALAQAGAKSLAKSCQFPHLWSLGHILVELVSISAVFVTKSVQEVLVLRRDYA